MRDVPWPLGLALAEGFVNARTGRWVSLIVVVVREPLGGLSRFGG